MTRDYFVDTSALIGLTFLSDRWFRDARELYLSEHTVHTSEIVLYEYCNRDRSTQPRKPRTLDALDVDFDTTDGIYGKKIRGLKKPLPEYFRQIRRLEREGLTLEKAVESFINHFEIREQATPQVKSYFNYYFDNRAVTAQYINDCAQKLIDKILARAKKTRSNLEKRVNLHDSLYADRDHLADRWKVLTGGAIHEPDLSILVDVTALATGGKIDYFMTGDSDLLQAQEYATADYDFSVISIQDELYPPQKWLNTA